ncbi:sugar transferase [Candidatus Burkholderia verschuerenii]|uniref:Sugar transferase n=1 Tax=Candidatus Burkholderia verschuerenii TaxID=242163 RepID=A0A0L0MDN9_9BURK|nr:glycosyltransferase [Candidatus Burkholderia verschuerenii]KND60416.1 sugar transferase [Candidatus Burkholderia verschuerenii]
MNAMDVPVIVFAYKRPDHLRKTLAALAASKGAKDTDVFIFCDGPRKPADADAVARTRKVAQNANGFRSVFVCAAEANQGLGPSVIAGVSRVLAEHDAVIVVEDDVEVAPGFLTFMRESLTRYHHDRRVFSVAGYALPVEGREAFGDVFFVPRICSWGWATWRDRWRSVDWDASSYQSFINDRRARAEFSRAGRDMLDMLVNQIEGEAESWAIRFDFGRFVNGDALTLYPVQSLAQNIGADGSGQHQGSTTHYETQVCSQIHFEFPQQVREAESMTREFARFYPRPWPSRLAIWARRLHVHGPMRDLFRYVFDNPKVRT